MSVTNREILLFYLHEMSKIGKSKETESRLEVTKGWENLVTALMGI